MFPQARPQRAWCSAVRPDSLPGDTALRRHMDDATESNADATKASEISRRKSCTCQQRAHEGERGHCNES